MIGDVTHEMPTGVECTNTRVSGTAVFVIPYAIRAFQVPEKVMIRKHFWLYSVFCLATLRRLLEHVDLSIQKRWGDAARRNERVQREEVQMPSWVRLV
jgi:hypothetical protein